MKPKKILLYLGILSIAGMLTYPVIAKEYPTKSIEIVVPYTPGVPVDFMSRLVAEMAPKYLGKLWCWYFLLFNPCIFCMHEDMEKYLRQSEVKTNFNGVFS